MHKGQFMGNYALLIGVSTYHHLPAREEPAVVENDLTALREILDCSEARPFEMKVLADPTQAEMEAAIQSFCRQRKAEDVLVLAFVGQGVCDRRGRLYWLACDSCYFDSTTLDPTSAIAASAVQTFLDTCPATQILVLRCGLADASAGTLDLEAEMGGAKRAVLWAGGASVPIAAVAGEHQSAYVGALKTGVVEGAADVNGDRQLSVQDLHDFALQRLTPHIPNALPQLLTADAEIAARPCLQLACSDPHAAYRQEVMKYRVQGHISTVGRAILETHQKQLQLSDAEAVAIQADVLRPYREQEENRRTYSKTLEKALRERYPLPPRVVEELSVLQQRLGLTAEEVAAIHETEFEPYRKAAEQRQQHLKIYTQWLQTEIARSLPLSAESRRRLRQKQQALGLSDADVEALEARVLAEEEQRRRTYQQNRHTLLQAWLEAVDSEDSVSADTLFKLQRMQAGLGIGDEDAKAIAHHALHQAEVKRAEHQAKCDRYQQTFLEMAQQSSIMGKEQRDYLQRLQQELGLSDRDILEAEDHARALLEKRQNPEENTPDSEPLASPSPDSSVPPTDTVPNADPPPAEPSNGSNGATDEAPDTQNGAKTHQNGVHPASTGDGSQSSTPPFVSEPESEPPADAPVPPTSPTDSDDGNGHRPGMTNHGGNGSAPEQLDNAPPPPDFQAPPVNQRVDPPSTHGNGSGNASAPRDSATQSKPSSPNNPIAKLGATVSQFLMPRANAATLETMTANPDVAAEVAIDYTHLRQYLEQQEWRAADRETLRIMVQATRRDTDGWITSEAILALPCEVLETLSDFWSTYSGGRFGFLAQHEVYESVYAENGRHKQPDNARLQDVASRLSWTGKSRAGFCRYDDLEFSSNAVKGHLPALWFFHAFTPPDQWLEASQSHHPFSSPDLRSLSHLMKTLKACDIT